MNDLMKPTIVGALIVALGIFLAAERIGYLLSFEGRWESCVKNFNKDAIRKVFGIPAPPSDERWAERTCYSAMVRTSN
jgi:hypothetical protein